MEEKNFDLKSFIGFILIGAILLYMMYQNQPSPNDTSLNNQTNQEEVVNKISKNDPKQSSFNLNDAFKKRDVLNSFDHGGTTNPINFNGIFIFLNSQSFFYISYVN